MRLFDHPGCKSGQCICREHLLACLIARELSDQHNGTAEKRRADELLAEGARLLDEEGIHRSDMACKEGE